jgi:phosphoglucosamine mutase
MDSDLSSFLAPSDDIGQAVRLDSANGRYIEYIKSTVPDDIRFDGLKIVVDCANGAGYKIAPKIFWELGAEVIAIHNTPNGKNINNECGATHTENLQKTVLDHQADLGIALDGDADRLIMVDQNGQKIDGDQLIAVLSVAAKNQGWLKGDGVVTTQMSNLGLEKYPQSITLHRSKVGDRYVVEMMKANSCNLGGEQSGHIILSDYATTGDGILAAVQILSIVQRQKTDVATLCNVFQPLPQYLENIGLNGVSAATVMDNQDVQSSISHAQDMLNGSGRVFVRPSGTEPLIRVMAEGDNEQTIKQSMDKIIETIKSVA